MLLLLAGLLLALHIKTYMKLSELTGALTALNNKVAKIATEVQALKDSLTDVELPAEAQEKLDALTASLQAVDDLNTDAPTPPPEPS